jgi:hypothetical protein
MGFEPGTFELAVSLPIHYNIYVESHPTKTKYGQIGKIISKTKKNKTYQ